MIATDPKAHSRFIGIKQAKRTLQKIERRRRLGKARPTDKQLQLNCEATIRKLESRP
jgi:hypothetical protein